MVTLNVVISRLGGGDVKRLCVRDELPREGEVLTVDGITCRVVTVSPIPRRDPYDAVVIADELQT